MINNPYKEFFRAFSNETRFEIIKLLREKERSVLEIADILGFEQSRVSHNLKCLADCGFVTSRPNGKKRIYSINQGVIVPMLKLIDKHIEKYESHLKKCGVVK